MKNEVHTSSMLSVSVIMRVLIAQYLIVFILCAGSAVFVGQDGVWTVLLTGAAYVVPSTLVSGFMALKRNGLRDRLGPWAVLIGEAVKILMVVILLGLVVGYYENLRWSLFIITLILVAYSYLLVLFKRN